MTEPLLIKSVWNIDMLLSLFSTCLQKGDVLCDLFAGTASASIAALLLGCDCVIVDHMQPHIHLCMQRINGHMNKVERNMKRFRTLEEDITKSLSMDDVSDVDI
jgi:23S rRNA G2069 N7-methylase RlmK/C1962 C5-methylase RlmI